MDDHGLSGIFDDEFIDFLFDLVEQTRHMQDETLNYSLIKLIVSVSCRIRNDDMTGTHVGCVE